MNPNQFDESRKKNLIYSFCLTIFLLVFTVGFLLLLHGCQYLPEVAKDIDDIATDNAIRIEVSRETFQKDTDLDITIQVNNKDVEVKP